MYRRREGAGDGQNGLVGTMRRSSLDQSGRFDQYERARSPEELLDNLRLRLRQLDANHPSAPGADHAGGEPENADGADVGDAPDVPDGQEAGAGAAATDGPAGSGRAAGDSGPAGPAAGLPGRGFGGLASMELPGRDRRGNPYRPWFMAGEPGSPWWTSGPF